MKAPFGAYEPDRPGLKSSDVIRNVIPTVDGYRPQPGFAALSVESPFSGADANADPPLSAAFSGAFSTGGEAASGFSAVCRGAWLTRDAAAVYSGFAAAATALYRTNSTTWANVSRSPYNLAGEDNWSGVQFGENLLVANVNDVIQRYQFGISTAFADLAGSPPQVRYLGVQGNYLLALSTAAYPNRLHRSGLNDITHWLWKQKGADYQDLPDGGWITGMTGRERGANIYSEHSIRFFEDQPGSPLLFTLAKAEPARGSVAPHSIVQVGNVDYFVTEDGFHSFDPANGSKPIGAERVDRTFLALVESLEAVQGAADPVNKIVWWRADGNTLFGYHYQLDRWTRIDDIEIQWLMLFANSGSTLEEVAALHPVLEDVPFSFDSRVWKGGRPGLAAFNSLNQLGMFQGANMEAVLETTDMQLGGDGRRAFASGYRLIGDVVAGAYGQFGTAEILGGARTWTAEAQQNATGLIPLRASGRTVRARARIPAGTAWSSIQGIEIAPESARQAGRR